MRSKTTPSSISTPGFSNRGATVCVLAAGILAAADPEFVTIPETVVEARDAPSGFALAVKAGSFLIGRTEITQREYRRVTETAPSHYRGEDRPVESVSWWDAIRYCNRRSQMERLQSCYDLDTGQREYACDGYRLPTETEWKIAAADGASSGMRTTGHVNTRDLLQPFETRGTAPVAAGKANSLGLHDVHGNVWEWCEDWFNADTIVDAVSDPQGPLFGAERTLRGGSFLTSPARWNKGLRSSMRPERKSPFTGFRVARTIAPASPPPRPGDTWLSEFHQKPAAMDPLPKSPPRSVAELRQQWARVLGAPDTPVKPAVARIVEPIRDLAWTGQLLDLESEQGYPARVLIVEPARKRSARLPVLIVPYYDVDTPAGANLGGRSFTPGGVRAFARLAAQRGFLAVAIRWFAEGDGEGYDEAVLGLARRHPRSTALGKWIWDAQRLVDYLVSRPDVDPDRIGMIGHSLGGKMALYAAAFDKRIAAIVSSEPGISLGFSNYGDFWYLGDNIRQLPAGADQHELLRLIAPRPFLLIAGESSDGDKSWPFLEAAREVYASNGAPLHIGIINHRSGHSPTPDSVIQSMEFFARFLGRGK